LSQPYQLIAVNCMKVLSIF